MQLLVKLYAYQAARSTRTALQTYKVEERTFGTPCN